MKTTKETMDVIAMGIQRSSNPCMDCPLVESLVGLMLIVYLPWIVGGAAIVIFCFWNEWYVAGVIIGILALLCQIFIGSALWDDSNWSSDSSDSSGDNKGFGLPEMFVAYKVGEHYGKKNKDDSGKH